MTEDEANLLGPLIQRAPMPHAAGMDALEARLVTVQEVPQKVELQFFAVRGQDRTRMPSPAAHAMVRELIPQRPIGELSDVEMLVEVSVLRAEVARLRPVYKAARALRDIHANAGTDVRSTPNLREVDDRCQELIDAVDAAIADEEKRA